MIIRTLTAIAAIPFISTFAFSGSLTPPGAPAPTMKTLDQIEPSIPVSSLTTPGNGNATYVISQPGAYHLTGNITGVSGKRGISISANDVTLDLRGFTLQGVPGSLNGIGSFGSGTHLLNGTVREWGDDGVRLTQNCRVENVHSVFNTGRGFYSTAGDSRFVGCTAENNTEAGFTLWYTSTVESCSSGFNAGAGIDVSGSPVGSVLLVSKLTAVSNSLDGLNALSAVVQDSLFRKNGKSGVIITRATVKGCIFDDNSEWGISGAGTLQQCQSISNGLGGYLWQGVVENCRSISDEVGFSVDSSVLRACIAQFPTTTGIVLGENSQAINCTVKYAGSSNSAIVSSGTTLIKDCIIDGGAISATGPRVVIDGCTVARAGSLIGIQVGDQAIVRSTMVTNAGPAGIYGGTNLTVTDCMVDTIAEIGIFGGVTSNISNCTVRMVGNQGIYVDAASRVTNNLVHNIGGDAIYATRLCRIEGNTVDLAGTAAGYNGSGVWVTLQSNRIHNNNLSRCDWSIRTSTGFNAITENSYSGWAIGATNLAAGNTLGTNYSH